MRMTNIDVSIIIVNYDITSLVVNAIDSLFHKIKDLTIEIIVISNVSNVGLKGRVGLGRVNNEGIKKIKGRNILLLNSDILLLLNSVKILSDYLYTHPKVGACGRNLYNIN